MRAIGSKRLLRHLQGRYLIHAVQYLSRRLDSIPKSCKSIPSCVPQSKLFLFLSLLLHLMVICQFILNVSLVLVKMVKHIPVFLLHPVLPCFILLLNRLIYLISLYRLQLDGRVLVFIKVQLSHSLKMILNILR